MEKKGKNTNPSLQYKKKKREGGDLLPLKNKKKKNIKKKIKKKNTYPLSLSTSFFFLFPKLPN